MKNIDLLKTFVLIIEENSFIGAGRKLNISKAAMSKRIAALEDELRVKLLVRTTRSLSLTDEGRILYEHSKRIFKELDEVEGLLAEMHHEPTGELFVISGPHFGEEYLLPHLPAFLERYPKVKLKLSFRQSMPDMIKEEVDIVCGLSIQGHPDAIQRSLSKTRHVLCASYGYLEKYGEPRVPDDLLRHHLITHSLRQPNNEVVFKSGQRIILEPFLILDDTRIMLQCALMDLGFIRVHHYVVEKALKERKLKEILPKYMEQKNTISLYLYYMKNRYLHPKIRLFVDFILNIMKQHESS